MYRGACCSILRSNADAVASIVAACQAEFIDADALTGAAASAGNLAIPLVKQLTARVASQAPEAAKYVHWGATSQDIIDSGMARGKPSAGGR